MKKLALLLLGFSLVLASSAQTTRTKFTNRNSDEKVANKIITTDSTLTYVDSVKLVDNEAGIVELTVVGYAKDTAYAVTGKIQARFNKRRGTLTLGTITEVEPITRDAVLANTNLGGATFTLVSVNNNVYVRVKGRAGHSITWVTYLKYKSVSTYSSGS